MLPRPAGQGRQERRLRAEPGEEVTAKTFRPLMIIGFCEILLGAFNSSLIVGLLGFMVVLMAVALRSRTIVGKERE